EPPRNVSAEFVGTRAVRLENHGTRAESLSIRVAPGFGGELLIPSGPFELAPGQSHEVPLYVVGGEPGADRLGLLIVGGPEPIVLQTEIRPECALASAPLEPPRRLPRRRPAAVAAWGAAMAAGLAVALAIGGRVPGISTFLHGGADAVAAQKLDVHPRVVAVAGVGGSDAAMNLPSAIVSGMGRAALAATRPNARSNRTRLGARAARRVARMPLSPAAAPPAVVALNVPDHAGSGGDVRVKYATKRASQVEVVANVGPVVVADRITSATNGSVTLPVPQTGKWVKIMSVRVMAQRDGGHATKSALIAIMPPDDGTLHATAASTEVSLR
ncbi:MAG: hypothetical protein KGM44_11705, partial [bacterium]|nr:hypothetical protein [bacterium]